MIISKCTVKYQFGIKNSEMDDLLTKRLNISPLDSVHSAFIFELVNSPGWKEFIGERNVNSIQDAEIYIINILANDNIKYHVISIKSKDIPIGIVTFIKRDYLDHHDIGFAFLPQYSGMGYALEASKYLLELYKSNHPIILATTKTDNIKSIKLLEKLGFKYAYNILPDKEINSLLVYQI